MKSSTLSAAMIVVACLLLFTQATSAQDVPRESGVDSYTSIEYDPDTNIVTAYSETDVTDYYLIPDYQAFVSMDIKNDSGSVLIYGSAYDYEGFGYASIILEVAGDPATTYTAQAGHQLRLNLYDDYSESIFPYRHVYDYYDNYFFGYYESFNIYEFIYHFFQNRGYNPRTRRRKAIILGKTHDSASVTTPRKPHHLKIISDDTERKFCGQLERRIVYQVVDIKGRPVGKVPIKELFPGIVTSSCDGDTIEPTPCSDEFVHDDGTFTDYLRSLCIVNDEYCGISVDPNKWQWCPPGRTSITLASMIYRLNHIEITVNGLDKLPIGGNIYPSGLMTYR